VGTISNLMDWMSRRSGQARSPVTVSAFGLTSGESFVAWQTISEIWGYKVDLVTSDEAVLEFVGGGMSIPVSEEQPGFEALEAAMIAAFPATSAWREAVLLPAFARNRTLLYRRA
jgi:hypothetical protein